MISLLCILQWIELCGSYRNHIKHKLVPSTLQALPAANTPPLKHNLLQKIRKLILVWYSRTKESCNSLWLDSLILRNTDYLWSKYRIYLTCSSYKLNDIIQILQVISGESGERGSVIASQRQTEKAQGQMELTWLLDVEEEAIPAMAIYGTIGNSWDQGDRYKRRVWV